MEWAGKGAAVPASSGLLEASSLRLWDAANGLSKLDVPVIVELCDFLKEGLRSWASIMGAYTSLGEHLGWSCL